MITEIFDNCVRSGGDLAGVFEYDGEVGYFYLYETDKKIIDAIHIVTGHNDFNESEISIRWNADEDMVALYIRSRIWAIFDTLCKQKHGGNYRNAAAPTVPDAVIRRFNT